MENFTNGQNPNPASAPEINNWAAAFEALDKKNQGNPTEDESGADNSNDNPAGASNQQVPNTSQAGNGEELVSDIGEIDSSNGELASQDGGDVDGLFSGSAEDFEDYKKQVDDSIKKQAEDDIIQELEKRGIKTISVDDEQIHKRDSDGVSHYYNPETGREFMGDNPRKQAQELVDDWNNEYNKTKTQAIEEYSKYLYEQVEPSIKAKEFAPKYNKLDDIRKTMFDNVIQDYELKDDDGDVIGYSCDLDMALALVNRQIEAIQSYAAAQQQTQQQPASGPALDMKTSSGAVQAGNKQAPRSLEEALEQLQDNIIEKNKR